MKVTKETLDSLETLSKLGEVTISLTPLVDEHGTKYTSMVVKPANNMREFARNGGKLVVFNLEESE